MERDSDPIPGKFRTVGQNMFEYNIDSLRIDTGLKYIYEGKTLACVNEKELCEKGFITFARESEGHAAIMLKDKYENEGKIVIDTASTKLFLEFTGEGTSRWISNAVIWLLNIDTFFSCNDFNDDKLPVTIPMNININDIKLDETVEKRIIYKYVNFCLTVVMDCTGSMGPYIEETKKTIMSLFRELYSIQQQAGLDESSVICAQFIGYGDYPSPIYKYSGIHTNMRRLLDFMQEVGPHAGSGGDTAEDCGDGIDFALDQIKDMKENYKHMILVAGDYPNHGDFPPSIYAHDDLRPLEHPIQRIGWDVFWENISIKLLDLDADVHCIALPPKYIFFTMDRLLKFYPKVKRYSAKDSNEFSNELRKATITQYKEYVGVS